MFIPGLKSRLKLLLAGLTFAAVVIGLVLLLDKPSPFKTSIVTEAPIQGAPTQQVVESASSIQSAAEPAAHSVPSGIQVDTPAPSPLTAQPSVAIEPLSTAAPIASVKEAVYQPGAHLAKISIPVLNYHSVAIQPGNRAAITPAKLEEQMRYLADQGYITLSLKQFKDIWEGRMKQPAKSVLITFDDGYKDNYTAAMPILSKHGFRATLFMSPGMVEDGYYLNWDEVKEMHRAGWDIQPHGMTHPRLPKLTAEKQEFEITEAKRQIEEQLGSSADVFCYPYGERNHITLRILKDHGFRYAFTIEQGKAAPDQQPYLIRRLFVDGEADLKSFKALLAK